jgi:hypothetical protein
MALIEVDEDRFRTSAAAHELLDKFYGNKKTRGKLLSLIKELNPEASIPELDAAAPLHDEVQKLREEYGGSIAELKAELARRDRNADVDNLISSERGKLRKAGWDDEGIAKIEKKMEDRGLHDYEAAAALVEKESVKAEAFDPIKSYDRSWNLATPEPDDDRHKLLMADRSGKRFQDAEIRKFFAERRLGAQ